MRNILAGWMGGAVLLSMLLIPDRSVADWPVVRYSETLAPTEEEWEWLRLRRQLGPHPTKVWPGYAIRQAPPVFYMADSARPPQHASFRGVYGVHFPGPYYQPNAERVPALFAAPPARYTEPYLPTHSARPGARRVPAVAVSPTPW